MLRQVPATWLIAASMVLAVRSGIFFSALSLTWAVVMVATWSLLGTPDRNLKAGLRRGALVEFLDKLGNVHAGLAESRADRGRSGRLCSGNLKLDITCNFLCHDKHLLNRCGDTL